VKIRSTLARSATARALYHRSLGVTTQAVARVSERVSFDTVPATVAVRLAYQVMLGREPDAVGWPDFVGRVTSGALARHQIAQAIRASEEFQNRPFDAPMLGGAIHAGRCQFIRSLPAARRIVDLGGTHMARAEGALVALGYPYPFEELVIVDLPTDDRHALYRSDEQPPEVRASLGTVRYRYHSMVDLSSFADESVDLVYSGQSIEHVTPDEGTVVLKEVLRILRPGGHLALDTPNGRLTRLQQDAFIDPDHKVEYTWPELSAQIRGAGFEIARAHGLNWGGPPAGEGRFDAAEAARHFGLHDDIEGCYVLAALCRKPG